MKIIALKQTRPFVVTISKAMQKSLIEQAKQFGVHYGVFFDTSGKARVERINPTAQYLYLFRTDKPD